MELVQVDEGLEVVQVDTGIGASVSRWLEPVQENGRFVKSVQVDRQLEVAMMIGAGAGGWRVVASAGGWSRCRWMEDWSCGWNEGCHLRT